ncbi:Uncharacterized protein APZ42_016817 [Daphnia magna]|uniref:Uncharacterized protein n=1 Tax=Daphnia magna TaxID=35525 RepID=A0A165A5M0_9CRUS|nr:Uncharacterized protein APZ42_016817 [Daphnia magna]
MAPIALPIYYLKHLFVGLREHLTQQFPPNSIRFFSFQGNPVIFINNLFDGDGKTYSNRVTISFVW